MTYRRAAALGAVTGAAFAGAVTVVLVLRAAVTITRNNRWYQLKQL